MKVRLEVITPLLLKPVRLTDQEKVRSQKKKRESGEGIRQTVADTPENFLICMEYCGICPSLPFPPEPLLFCARGCASEMISKRSCNCPACPIYKKYRLQNLYFCETGKAIEKKEEKRHEEQVLKTD